MPFASPRLPFVGSVLATLVVSATLAHAAAPNPTPTPKAPAKAAVKKGTLKKGTLKKGTLKKGTLKIVAAEASSELPPANHYRFDAMNVIDGDPTTCWKPNAHNFVGTWLKLTLSAEAKVTGLAIHNGFQRKDARGDLFALNGRLTDAWVVFDHGAAELIRVSPRKRGTQVIRFARPHRTRTVTLVVRDVKDGDKEFCLALSEVAVRGRAATGPAKVRRKRGPCASPLWSVVQRNFITACLEVEKKEVFDFREPWHYDAVLRCRDVSTGRRLRPAKAELGKDHIKVEFDDGEDMSLLFELSRAPDGTWKVEDLLLGSSYDP